MAARITAYLVVAIVAATLIAGLIVGAQRDASDGPVDLIVRNARVYTAREGRMAEAVAVRGNQILDVGSDREIARLQRPQTTVIDAGGAAVLPGFNDSHLNLLEGALALRTVDLTRARSATEMLDRIEAWSTANPSSPWIVGHGWSPEHFKDGQPTRQMLDPVVSRRPAVMLGIDESRPIVWVNSHALRLAGITRQTPDPVHGAIARDPRTKDPTGVLSGTAARLVWSKIPEPGEEERAAALQAAIAEAHAFGITSVRSSGTAETFEAYDRLRRAGELTVRVYAALSVEPMKRSEMEERLSRYAEIRSKYPDDPLLKSGALVLQLDGDIATRSAALLEPYEEGTESGETTMSPDDLNRFVRLADADGWQVITRATGDRAVRMGLDAYAHALRSNRRPSRGRRHQIQGLGLVDPADLPRFESLGIGASMHPSRGSRTPQRLELLTRHLGAARASRTFAFDSLAATTTVTFGSLWPAYPLSPMLGLHISVNGRGAEPGPDPPGPASGLALSDAIAAYTSSAAWASFDDGRKGLIGAGMLADLVVLNRDIFDLPAEDLATVGIAYTVFDGKVVYQRAPRAETAPLP